MVGGNGDVEVQRGEAVSYSCLTPSQPARLSRGDPLISK